MTPDTTVLCGGVGAARMLAALSTVTDPRGIVGVVNTGDDTVLNGLRISPDLDTITYTLAGAIDTQRGWGLVGDTWTAMEALRRYESVAPGGSAAAQTWFRLGDRDLATHLYRTTRCREGATLTEVTDEIRRAWGVEIVLHPMSDERVSTRLRLRNGAWIGFQDYFVRRAHGVPITAVAFDSDEARLSEAAAAAIGGARRVVIAPSNPLVSIGPIRSLPGTDELLAARRDSVVAVSPIVGGVALKGPADRLLLELGHDPSVVGVARLYAPIAAALVVDPLDAHLAPGVEQSGMRCVVSPSIMSTPQAATNLAVAVLAAVPSG